MCLYGDIWNDYIILWVIGFIVSLLMILLIGFLFNYFICKELQNLGNKIYKLTEAVNQSQENTNINLEKQNEILNEIKNDLKQNDRLNR